MASVRNFINDFLGSSVKAKGTRWALHFRLWFLVLSILNFCFFFLQLLETFILVSCFWLNCTLVSNRGYMYFHSTTLIINIIEKGFFSLSYDQQASLLYFAWKISYFFTILEFFKIKWSRLYAELRIQLTWIET